jgi:hypothetical protein
LAAVIVTVVALWVTGTFPQRDRERPREATGESPAKGNAKLQRLERQYEELKTKVGDLQARGVELKRIRAAHDDTWASESALGAVPPDRLTARTKEINDDADAITANAKAIIALYQEMGTILDEIERETGSTGRSKVAEKRQELTNARDRMPVAPPAERPALAPHPPISKPKELGRRILSQDELKARERRLMAENEREKTELVPLKVELENQRKAFADAIRRAKARTITAKALAQAQERFQTTERKYQDLAELIEQNRRRTKKAFPVPEDPEYISKGNGDLYTREEYERAKKADDQHGSPQKAADYYVKQLLRDGSIEKASFLAVRTLDDPRDLSNTVQDITGDFRTVSRPKRDCRTVWYRVRYVSRGGTVNERDGFVGVYVQDGYWYVFGSTRLEGISFPK